jgi:hypothetical protein
MQIIRKHRQTILTSALVLALSFATLAKARAESLGADLGLYGSWGSMKDTTASIPTVHTSTAGAYLLPRITLLPGFALGAYAEYDMVGQLTAPSSVNGNNEACSGYLGGGALVLGMGMVHFTGLAFG